MAEEKKKTEEKAKEEKETEKKAEAVETKKEEKVEKKEIKEEKIKETKAKAEGKDKKKKEEAIARGLDLSASKKHCIAICKMIKGKKIERAVKELEQVIKLKKAVRMKGEIPHKKGIGSGRYPVNASKVMIKLLKGLDANARALEILNPVIVLAKADKASRPYRRFGSRRFKRTNVLLAAREGREIKEKS